MKPIGPKKLPYRGGVPRHFGCRSTEGPLTFTWRELGIDMDEIPEGTRRSMDGEVPESVTADKWMKNKYKTDPAMVEKVFGKERARLFGEGRLNARQMMDQSGRPLTLGALKERHPSLFNIGGKVERAKPKAAPPAPSVPAPKPKTWRSVFPEFEEPDASEERLKFKNARVAEEWGRKNFVDFDKLTPEESQALKTYQRGGHENINGLLRHNRYGGPGGFSDLNDWQKDSIENDIKALNAAFKNHGAYSKEGFVTYSGLSRAEMRALFGVSEMSEVKLGTVFSDPAFTSTSLLESTTELFGPQTFQFRIPPNLKFLWAQLHYKDYYYEAEVLLPPGLSWKVVGFNEGRPGFGGRRFGQKLILELVEG